ncbi:MAG: hypothetical protein JST82_08385 [Bacteroidetes bacterium]|nr:hypothetical protein [Bacteroidota bacterium]
MKHASKLTLLLVVTNLLTLSVMLNGCDPEEDPANNANKTTTTASNCYPAVTATSGFQGLNALLVYRMAKEYRLRQLSAINSAYYATTSVGATPTDGDARSVWFDMETIKRFIYTVETTTCNRCGNNSNPRLGIRVYYGTYPDTTDTIWNTSAMAGVDRSFAGKHTVMFVPTYFDSASNANVDFDPQFVTGNCDFTAIQSFYETMKTATLSTTEFTILSSMNGMAQNHGDMIPPPYGKNDILGKGAGIMYAADGTVH